MSATIHFHSSDTRFCGSPVMGRRVSFDLNEVNCPACEDNISAALTEAGRARLEKAKEARDLRAALAGKF